MNWGWIRMSLFYLFFAILLSLWLFGYYEYNSFELKKRYIRNKNSFEKGDRPL
jgi:hypothetical protein